MGKLTKNQHGFAAAESVLIVIIIAVIGGTGYYVYHAKHNADKTLNTASSESSAPTSAKSVPTPKAVPSVLQYTDRSGGYSVSYPKGWKTSDCSGTGQTSEEKCIDFASPDFTTSGTNQVVSGGGDFSISHQQAEYSSIHDYTTQTGQDKYGTLANVTDVKVNGINAIRAESTGLGGGLVVEFVHDGDYWVLSYGFPDSESSTSATYLAQFDALTQSFKFN